MLPEARKTLLLAALGLAASVILVGRAFDLCVLEHERLRERARRQQTLLVEMPGKRGRILDRWGGVLATSVVDPVVELDPASPDFARARRLLVRMGLLSREEARRMANRRRVTLFRRTPVPKQVSDALSGLESARLIPVLKRFYPHGSLCAHTLGLVGAEGKGLSGLEYTFDSWLAGTPGVSRRYRTASGGTVKARAPEVLRRPRDGGSVRLTIDKRIQAVVEHHLCRAAEQYDASWGFALVLEPSTGDVLALASVPGFDPMAPGPIEEDYLAVPPVAWLFEPGSTFKVVPFVAALEAGAISLSDSLDCGDGVRLVGGCRIHDAHPCGRITAEDVLVRSSNIGAGLVAEAAGWESVLGTARRMGFGNTTGIGLPGESAGDLPHPLGEGWSERSLATVAYGQEISCTALQLAAAYCAIANDGVLMRPRLVDCLIDAAGREVYQFPAAPVRRAMRVETARRMRRLLREVVLRGTGRAAEVVGLEPAGKTGTAQVYDAEQRHYSRDEHVLSFVGLAPWEHPSIVCLVGLRTEVRKEAGAVAAPLFASILEDLRPFLDPVALRVVEPGEPTPGVLLPSLEGMAAAQARRLLLSLGLMPVLEGTGDFASGTWPPPLSRLREGSVVRVRLGYGEAQRVVPDVRGLPLTEAARVLLDAGFRVDTHGFGWVMRQDPPPLALSEPGALCTVVGTEGGEASVALSDRALDPADVGRTSTRLNPYANTEAPDAGPGRTLAGLVRGR